MRMATAVVTALTLTAGTVLTAGAATAVTPAKRTVTPAATTTTPAASATAESKIRGLWRVNGYGAVWSIGPGTIQKYETTSVSCLKGDSGKRTGPGRYATKDGAELTVRAAHGRDRATLRMDASVGHQELRRVGKLPAACTRPAPQGPVAAFDVFWQSFEENYPFFAAKGIDWHAVRDRYRPKVHADTTREELFTLFSEMADPLEDAHVGVGYGDRFFGRVRSGTVMPSEELDARVKKFVLARDLKGAEHVQDFAKGRITYADLPGGKGYLRISGFSGYADDGAPYSAHLAELDRTLGTVFTKERTRSLKGLIVDLRINGGGSDELGLRIASRLTDTGYVAHSKRARNDPADPTRHTRPQPLRVTPADAPRYTGPIAVLTGGSTVSAGETFTQALIDRPGRTVRIGQPTQGVFSDILPRRLPFGGMGMWLPNEEFLTRSGTTFDGPGIPPHLTEPVFTEEEFEKNRDSAFDRALKFLATRGGPQGTRDGS
ncbi:S41 family peptidase [Streptomyces lasiicapitis]|uniref:Peptidase n=1 Tax=Streptomyces lasiicapitis TaxID=1923961 RepID=A0ABQ2MB19_9ACTN|nr:S41 family peptidase [Streptomyces lasiicapitis]GGO49000.1 peptidase [Streptomyces lasiicapitis]